MYKWYLEIIFLITFAILFDEYRSMQYNYCIVITKKFILFENFYFIFLAIFLSTRNFFEGEKLKVSTFFSIFDTFIRIYFHER